MLECHLNSSTKEHPGGSYPPEELLGVLLLVAHEAGREPLDLRLERRRRHHPLRLVRLLPQVLDQVRERCKPCGDDQ